MQNPQYREFKLTDMYLILKKMFESKNSLKKMNDFRTKKNVSNWKITTLLIGPHRDKTNEMACSPSKDSDQSLRCALNG